MCVYIATAAGSMKICVRFNYTTPLLTPRGYGIVCILVVTILVQYTLSHQHLCMHVVYCHYTCILLSTYRIVHSTGLVFIIMLLELKNFCRIMQTSTTIMNLM